MKQNAQDLVDIGWTLHAPYRRKDSDGKDSAYWSGRARCWKTGRMHYVTTSETNEKKAKAALLAWVRLIADPTFKANHTTFEQAMDEWMATKKIRPKTAKIYAGYVQDFKAAWGKLLVSEVTKKQVDAFFVALDKRVGQKTGKTTAPSTQRSYANFLSSFFEDCMDHEYCDKNPARSIKTRPVRSDDRPVLTLEETRRLLQVAREPVPVHISDKGRGREFDQKHRPSEELFLALLLFGWTGLRRKNALGLRRGWINLFRRSIRIPPEEAKAGKTIVVPMSKELTAAIEERLRTLPQGDDVRLFRRPRIDESFQNALDRAGLPPMRIHDLRHSFSSMLHKRGLGDVARKVLGHANKDVHDRYVHLDFEFLRDTIDSLPSLLTPPAEPSVQQPEAKQA